MSDAAIILNRRMQHRFAKIREFDRPMASFRPGVMGMRAERTRFLHRKGRDGSHGSPRFFTAQRTLVRNDNSLMNVLVDTPVWWLALRGQGA